MKFNRRFYDAKLHFGRVSKRDWILAGVIGLLSALVIYSFLFVIIETFRRMSLGFLNFPNIVSQQHRRIYNLFFAGLAMIFGNSIAIAYLFSPMTNVLSRRHPKRTRIVNDQIFLNGGFSMCAFRWINLMGVFSIGMMDFQYLPFLYPIGILILVVLYLDTWKTLLRILGKKKYHYLLVHFIAYCVLSFGLSQINALPYKKLDKAVMEWNPTIDLPASSYYTEGNGRYDLYITYKVRVKEDGQLEIIDASNQRLSLKELADAINAEKASRRYEVGPFIIVSLMADRHMPMRYIIDIQNAVCNTVTSSIQYVVNYGDPYAMRFTSQGITSRVCNPYFLSDSLKSRHTFRMTDTSEDDISKVVQDRYEASDKLFIDIGKEIKVNGLSVPDAMLVKTFKNKINAHTIFEYRYTIDTAYENYIKVLSAQFEAVDALRKKHQTIELETDLETWNYINEKAYNQHIDSLKQRFPLRKIERILDERL